MTRPCSLSGLLSPQQLLCRWSLFHLHKTTVKPRNITEYDSCLESKLKTLSLSRRGSTFSQCWGGSTFSQCSCAAMPTPFPSSSHSLALRLPPPAWVGCAEERGFHGILHCWMKRGEKKRPCRKRRKADLEAAEGTWRRQRHWDRFKAHWSRWKHFNGAWIRPLQWNEMQKQWMFLETHKLESSGGGWHSCIEKGGLTVRRGLGSWKLR